MLFLTFRYYIRDKNSSNGVKKNGAYIEPDTPIELRDGDIILIGNVQLVFHAEVARRQSSSDDNPVKLVTILPSRRQYEETVTIRTEIQANEVDFKKVSEVGVCTNLSLFSHFSLYPSSVKITRNCVSPMSCPSFLSTATLPLYWQSLST